MKTLIEIQKELKVPKGQYNSFGKYHYRSCEDIIEALKPVIHPKGLFLRLTDEIVLIGERYYVKATAELVGESVHYTSLGFAREEESKKGMDGSQVTGAASSYARKYALNGLLAIDDSKDSDVTSEEKDDREPLDQLSPNWGRAVDFIKQGGKIEAIEQKYKLSELDRNELEKHAPQG
jgi:hypothetical protein